jgi:diguanylate cyclase (GGDEF)-like protein
VHNRRAFLDTLASRLGHLRRYQRAGALLFIDLDNFKALNDRRGHAAGDAALIAVARLLGEGSRRGDVAGRLGGDEFALWLEETDAAGAAAKADALIAAVAREPAAQAGDPDRALGVSIGIALWPLAVAGNDSPAALVARADAAMYAAKRDGKNRWSLAGTG